MIDAEGVVFDYPSGRALHGVGFVVRAGAVLALVGPEGAGKSTLLRCIAALDAPTRGRISVAGLDTQDQALGVHARIGYVPDRAGLYDALTVGQSLAYAARLKGVGAAEAPAAAARAADRVGLAARFDTRAGALAAGSRRRLVLGQALVHDPKALLLDLSPPAPDNAVRGLLAPLLPALAARGATVVVAARALSGLEGLCTDLLALEDGRLAGEGVVRL